MMPPSSPLLLVWLQSLLILRLIFEPVNDLLECDSLLLLHEYDLFLPYVQAYNIFFSKTGDLNLELMEFTIMCKMLYVFFKGGDHSFHQIFKVILYLKKSLLFS